MGVGVGVGEGEREGGVRCSPLRHVLAPDLWSRGCPIASRLSSPSEIASRPSSARGEARTRARRPMGGVKAAPVKAAHVKEPSLAFHLKAEVVTRRVEAAVTRRARGGARALRATPPGSSRRRSSYLARRRCNLARRSSPRGARQSGAAMRIGSHSAAFAELRRVRQPGQWRVRQPGQWRSSPASP